MKVSLKGSMLTMVMGSLAALCVVLWAVMELVSRCSLSHADLLTVIVALALAGTTVLLLALSLMIRNWRLQRELREDRERRGEAEELRLAAVGLAHEAKNPLGIIRGLAQQIADDAQNPDPARQKARDIMEEADITTARLGDFMTYAKIREPELVEIDGEAHVEHVCNLVKDEFKARGVTFLSRLEKMRIQADPEMLSQVLLNLLSNSLKSTSAGGKVAVTLTRTELHHATLVVSDSGIGISPEFLPHLFKPYASKRSDGHGIGLAIVKKIVDESGWDIEVRSQPGVGTEVRITRIAAVIHGGQPVRERQ